MSLSVQKINLDVTIIRFEDFMTPEEFAKELSGVVGKEIWKYTQNVYFNETIREYVFYCGLGKSLEKYYVLSNGAIFVDIITNKQIAGYIGHNQLSEELEIQGGEIKTTIGNEFKGFNIIISLRNSDNSGIGEFLNNSVNISEQQINNDEYETEESKNSDL